VIRSTLPRTSLLLLLLAAAAHATSFEIDLAQRRELFVDNFLIDRMQNLDLRLHAPEPCEVALHFDAPWEGRYCGYVTILQDGPLYRMYYRGLPEAGKDGSNREVTCYAQSSDGITWEKPALGLFEVGGTRENNVVLADTPPFSHNFAPFLDTRPGVPAEERFKALAGTSETGLVAFASADGINWKKWRETPLITDGAFDSQNVAFWSEAEQQYVCYLRVWSEGGYKGFRSIARCTSPDFLNWSSPVEMDYGETPREHLYTNQTLPYFRAPHLYIALAARFMPDRRVLGGDDAARLGVENRYAGDCSDTVLLTSRGGNRYDRTFMEGFVRPAFGLEHWTSRSNYAARGILQTGPAEISIYIQQHYGLPTAHLTRYRMRLDGFASVHGNYGGGILTTKPLRIGGSRLFLNFATSAAGGIRVELLDARGKPIPGYAREDALELVGNQLDAPVRWKEHESMETLIDTPLRVNFLINDADLYAIQFR
jgi:hypothetical protein